MLNPKPCPLLGSSEPGDWRLPTLGEDLDIRTDIPYYRIWKNGVMISSEDVEGNRPRTLFLEVGTGKTWFTTRGEVYEL